MEKDKNNVIYKYYYYKEGIPKKNGIYCQQLDRWILIDDYDHNITLKTAQTLSSKIATTVYILPKDIQGMDNKNCVDYCIFDKTEFKRKRTADLIQSQTPTLKRLKNEENILRVGVPEDFKSEEKAGQITKLKNFVDYVNKATYAVELLKAKNWIDNKVIADSFFPDEWNEVIFSYEDNSTDGKGVLNQISSILYLSNTIVEAQNKINELFRANIENRTISMDKVDFFFDVLMKKNPFA